MTIVPKITNEYDISCMTCAYHFINVKYGVVQRSCLTVTTATAAATPITPIAWTNTITPTTGEKEF